ncbi:MAG: hypothetical protein GIW99_02700 [Candidatus Eremiobacteraeota bacterium]|nr:hypothetical protein [Candidatus Eremiobacteraeota bacterium]
MYSLQAFVAAAKREQLRLHVQRERKELKALYDHNRPGRWTEWLGQQALEGDKAAVAALRRRRYREASRSLGALQSEVGIVAGATETQAAVLSGIRWTIHQDGVNYAIGSTTVFRDEGRRVVFIDLDDDAIRAGLMLCSEKWAGGISIDGTDEFKAKAHALVTEMGIRVAGPASGRPLGTKQVELGSTSAVEAERSEVGALDIARLSATHGKAVTESEATIGRQHTGRIVAAGRNTNGDGAVVLDIGRELAVIHTQHSLANEMRARVGSWIQARTSANDRFPGGYFWRFTDVRHHRLSLEFGQQR